MGIASEAAIYNLTLDLLDEATVTDPGDDTRAARLLKRNYPHVRDAVLRAHPWNFAISRLSLPSDGAPAFGFERRFVIPGDVLRVLPLTQDGETDGYPVKYRVEGKYILTDALAPLPTRVIERVTDTTRFDPLFVQALAAFLAFRVGHVITGKRSYTETSLSIYRTQLVEARRIDALEDTPEEKVESDFILARQ